MTTNQQPNMQQLMAEIERLKLENQALQRAKASSGHGIKVSAKGAISLYGLGRFPVTLYAESWKKVFDKKDEILAFISNAEREGLIVPKDKQVQVNA